MFAYIELLQEGGLDQFFKGAQFNTYVYGPVLLCHFSVWMSYYS